MIGNGGELIDGYGFYGIKSPAGVQIRAYVDDRRDPVEFVALRVPAGPDSMTAAKKTLEGLGLRPRGAYTMVSPPTQEYMPTLPPGNILYAGADPKASAQVLLAPAPEEAKKPLFELPRGTQVMMDENEKLSIGFLDAEEKPDTPISTVQGSKLVILAPAADVSSARSGSDWGIASRGSAAIELRSATSVD